MGTPQQEDCSYGSCILEDIGAGFCIGGVGGSAFNFLKGVYNSPSGARLAGGYRAFLTNAPHIAGSFAAFLGLHTAVEHTMIRARRTEDPRNSIIGGAAAGGIIKMHRGLGASARWTLYGGAIATLIEGAMIMIMAHKVEAKQNQTKWKPNKTKPKF